MVQFALAKTTPSTPSTIPGSSDAENTVILADNSTIVIDASKGNVFKVSPTGQRILTITNPVKDGQTIRIEFYQKGGGNLSLETGENKFRFGQDAPQESFVLSKQVGKKDYFNAIYDDSTKTWDVVSLIRGY